MSRNLKITLSYDGTEFHGWQVQPGLPTVQGTLATAIGRITGENVLPQGSGRTDAGVHALAQVASVRLRSSIPERNLVIALNDTLPPAIRVYKVQTVADDFHARGSAKAKIYRYRIYRNDICPPFLARYVYHDPYPMDEDAVMHAAQHIVGEHDFTSFAASDPDRACRSKDAGGFGGPVSAKAITNVRTVFHVQWARTEEELVFAIRGNGFLHHMVRNLIGTFLLAGKHAIAPSELPRILAARDRSAAGPTAPASGLYLVDVEY